MFAKKALSQNFLIDSKIIQKIVLQQNDFSIPIVEIGPGQGALTKHLVKRTLFLQAYEIDTRCIDILNNSIKTSNLEIINKDFLQVDFNDFNRKINIFGNIPYKITSLILFKLLRNNFSFNFAILMVQKEVGERILAKFKSSNYSKLSVVMQTFFKIEKIINVPSQAFKPPPKVNSMVLKLVPKRVFQDQDENFLEFLKKAFQFRRKTLWNNLKNVINWEIFQEFCASKNLKNDVRAQEINLENFKELFNKYIKDN